MVNTGYPSGACATCKIRKIKCDETTPQCMRCKSTGRECPGYEQKGALKFRDETIKVHRKARRTVRSGALAPINASNIGKNATGSPCSFGSTEDVLFDSLYQNLNWVSPEDTAIAFFFQHFVPTSPRYYDRRGTFLNQLGALYADNFSASAVHTATSAVALAVVSKYPDKRQFRPLAAEKYGQALRKLAFILADREEAKTDETLMCAILLIFYESLTNELSRQAHRKHLDGLSSIVKNRGDSQFRNRSSLGQFRGIRSFVALRCMHDGIPMEDFWVRDDMIELNSPSQFPRAESSSLAVRISRLRKRAMDLSKAEPGPFIEADAKALFSDAEIFDKLTMSAWSQESDRSKSSPFPVYQVEISDDPDPSHTWRGMVHVYKSVMHALYMNSFRINRIYLQAVKIACLARISVSEGQLWQDPRYKEASRICQDMVDDICACVPSFIGDDLHIDSLDGELDDDTRAAIADRSLGAYQMIFPLLVAFTLEITPEDQKTWIKGRLITLADRYGFELAKSISQVKPGVIYGLAGMKERIGRGGRNLSK